MQSLSKVFHPNILSATKVKSMQREQIFGYKSSANCQILESRPMLNILTGCNKINNYNGYNYRHINPIAAVTRTYAILANDRNNDAKGGGWGLENYDDVINAVLSATSVTRRHFVVTYFP